ncbi:MAG: hypothetical protein WAN43_18320 [Rhodomicrobium sp.]
MGEHLERAKGLLYLIIAGILTACLAFIVAGLGLVYLGASGSTKLTLFGLEVSTTNVGIVSVILGALSLIILIQKALAHIQGILALQRGPHDR